MKQQIRKVLDDELQLIKAIPDCDEFEWERTARTAFVHKLEAIIAALPTAATLKPGWLAKDRFGLWYYSKKPSWSGYWSGMRERGLNYEQVSAILTDPWSESHPNGGPECLLEVG